MEGMGKADMGSTRYDAFISYSHSADGRLAPAVQSGLQRLARPWYRIRALRVFRDETGLAVNPHLWTSISTALDESKHFVLLASPDAAASPWVGREIETWLASHPADRILPVLTDGELVWDSAAGRYDPVASTALPPALATAFKAEPRHLDLRWARTDDQLDLRNAGFRAAIADLAAPMHGISREDLEGEDVRQHHRAMRLAWGGAALLALVTVLAVLAATFAVRFANTARANERRAVAEQQRASEGAVEAATQRTRAQHNEVRATTAQEKAEANAVRAATNAAEADAQRSQAETSAAEATRNAANARANGQRAEEKSREALRNAADAQASARQAATSAAEAQRNAEAATRAAATAQASQQEAERERATALLQKARAEESEQAARASATVARSRHLAASALNVLPTNADRALLMAVQARAFDDSSQARGSVVRTLQRQPEGLTRFVPTATPSFDPVAQVVTNRTGRTAVTITRQGAVTLHALPSGRTRPSPDFPPRPSGAFTGAELSPDGGRVALAWDGALRVWDVAAARVTATVDLPEGNASAVAFSADGTRVAIADPVRLRVVDAATGAPVGPTIPFGLDPVAVTFDAPAGRLAAVGFDPSAAEATVRVFSASTGETLAEFTGDSGACICVDTRGVLALRFERPGGSDRLTLVPMGVSEQVLISWDLRDGRRVRDVPVPAAYGGKEVAVAVNAGLDTVVTSSSDDGRARVRDLVSGDLVRALDARLPFCSMCGSIGGSTRGVTFGPGTTVVTAGTDNLVRMFDFRQQPDRLATLVTDDRFAVAAAISRDGSTVAQVDGGQQGVTVIDAATGAVHATVHASEGTIDRIALSPDGTALAMVASFLPPGGTEIVSEVSAWDARTGSRRWSARDRLVGVGGMTFDRTGARLALTGGLDQTFDRAVVEVWDARTGAPTAMASAPSRAFLFAPEFSPDGTLVWASRSGDGVDGPTLQAYDARSGDLVRRLDDPRLLGAGFLQFSTDGSTALSLDTTATKVNVMDGKTLALRREVPLDQTIWGTALSPDGSMFTVMVSQGRSALFAADTGEQLSDLLGPDVALAAQFSPNGRRMLVAGETAVMRVDTDPASWARAACDVANRDLSTQEWVDLLGTTVPYARTCTG
jgi:WD40 repeat protein